MSFLSRLFSKASPPAAPRRVIDVTTAQSLLKARLLGHTQPNYHAVWTKSQMACVSSEDIERASKKSFAPWVEHVWECEDFARSLIESAQRRGASEGHTLALGVVFGDPLTRYYGLTMDDSRHVYVFGVFRDASISFFDPVAQRWCRCPDNIYFSML